MMLFALTILLTLGSCGSRGSRDSYNAPWSDLFDRIGGRDSLDEIVTIVGTTIFTSELEDLVFLEYLLVLDATYNEYQIQLTNTKDYIARDLGDTSIEYNDRSVLYKFTFLQQFLSDVKKKYIIYKKYFSMHDTFVFINSL